MDNITIAGGVQIEELTILVFVFSDKKTNYKNAFFLAFDDSRILDKYEYTGNIDSINIDMSYSDSLFRFYNRRLKFLYFSNTEKRFIERDFSGASNTAIKGDYIYQQFGFHPAKRMNLIDGSVDIYEPRYAPGWIYKEGDNVYVIYDDFDKAYLLEGSEAIEVSIDQFDVRSIENAYWKWSPYNEVTEKYSKEYGIPLY